MYSRLRPFFSLATFLPCVQVNHNSPCNFSSGNFCEYKYLADSCIHSTFKQSLTFRAFKPVSSLNEPWLNTRSHIESEDITGCHVVLNAHFIVTVKKWSLMMNINEENNHQDLQLTLILPNYCSAIQFPNVGYCFSIRALYTAHHQPSTTQLKHTVSDCLTNIKKHSAAGSRCKPQTPLKKNSDLYFPDGQKYNFNLQLNDMQKKIS